MHSGTALIRRACLLVERERKLLLVRVRDNDLWYLPGGTIERGETAEAALIREVREELGVEIDAASINPARTIIGPAYGRPGLVELNCFTAEWSGDPAPHAEVAELGWMGADDRAKVAPAIVMLFDTLWPIARTARPAARLLMLDPQGAVLLFRFDVPDRLSFWATPGGACDPGESHDEAARREMLEETGWALDPGPEVHRRRVEFTTIEGDEIWSDERYYLVRVPERSIRTDGHTDLERRVMQHHHWWTVDELAASDAQIFPEDLGALVARVSGRNNDP